jgi:nicotinamidase-related amidase
MPEPDETTTLDPARSALLVMDYQPGIISRLPDPDRLVDRVRRAIGAVRAAGATVAFVRVGFTEDDLAQMPETAAMTEAARRGGDALHADSPATQVDERLAPAAADIIVRKVRVGAFSSTDLHDRLRERGIDTLVLERSLGS